jgi:3-oxoadipate enol-lactonase
MTGTHTIAATLGAMAVALAAGDINAGPTEELHHGFAPVNGTRLFYEVRGAGPAVVLIHGGQLDCRMWGEQLDAFSQGYRVIRYDVRGYGGSPRPDLPYSDAEDLAALLDYLGVDKAHLVGLSLGGRIAVDFALAHPARVGSLTLAGPGLSGFEPPGGAESDLRMWEIIKAARDEGPDKATALWLKDPFMAPAMEQARLVPVLRKIARENAHCWLENPILQRPPKPAAATRLGEIKVPTLLVLGDRDVPQIRATVETLERGIRGAKKVSIPSAGHMVNMESPDAFNKAVLGFLHDRERRPAAPSLPAAGGAGRSDDTAVDPTEARKEAGHAHAAAGTEPGGPLPDVRYAGKMTRRVERGSGDRDPRGAVAESARPPRVAGVEPEGRNPRRWGCGDRLLSGPESVTMIASPTVVDGARS